MEIFECGTGNGALTLHLSRAIHAANGTPPSGEDPAELEQWKSKRKAILHTLDISEKHSKHAQKTVKGFRNGMYSGNVDFHVGEPASFFAQRTPNEPFLNHVILDMPAAHDELARVAPFVHIGGSVLVFVPSITQITKAQRTLLKDELPLFMEQVLEVGQGISGGREWSIKVVKTRATMRAASEVVEDAEAAGRQGPSEAIVEESVTSENEVPLEQVTSEKEEWVDVCRPKPGKTIQGGGFVGIWKRVASRTGFSSDSGYDKGLKDSEPSPEVS